MTRTQVLSLLEGHNLESLKTLGNEYTKILGINKSPLETVKYALLVLGVELRFIDGSRYDEGWLVSIIDKTLILASNEKQDIIIIQ